MADMLSIDLLTFIRDEVAMVDEQLDEGTDLLLGGAVDSLGVIRITHWLEERTGTPVPPSDVTLDNFQSVDAITAYALRSSAVTPGS